MNLDEIYGTTSENLKADDLAEKDATLTIAGWTQKEFNEKNDFGEYKAKKVILSFKETEKTIVLNKINSYTIADFLKSKNVDEWIGAAVVLYKTKTTSENKRSTEKCCFFCCKNVRIHQQKRWVRSPSTESPMHRLTLTHPTSSSPLGKILRYNFFHQNHVCLTYFCIVFVKQ